MPDAKKLFKRRRTRIRSALRKKSSDRPRLSIHRTSQHIYVQIIDDKEGKTLVSASTAEKSLKGKTRGNKEGAVKVGKLVAERAKKAGLKRVVFDRGGFIYHGRVRALAEGAREGGLEF